MRLPNFQLLFFGSDNFSVRVLNALLNVDLCPISVVTKCGSILDRFSAHNRLQALRWPLEWPQEKTQQFNIGLVASFGHMIDIKTISKFRYGLFNIHPSLLPRYRGSSPIQAAILDGLDETGCTIMRIPPIAKFDIGDIVQQEKLKIEPSEYAFELSDRLAFLGAKMTQNLLINYDHYLALSRPQGEEGKSYSWKIKPEHGLIKFRSEDSSTIDRKVRAYTGYIDLHTTCCHGLKVSLSSMRELKEIEKYNLERALNIHLKAIGQEDYVEAKAGTIFFHKPRQILGIKPIDGKWVAFDYCTVEHKPRMTALEFYNGYLSSLDHKNMMTDL